MKTLTNYADLTESHSRIYVLAYWLCYKNIGRFQEAACVLWIRLQEAAYVLWIGFLKAVS